MMFSEDIRFVLLLISCLELVVGVVIDDEALVYVGMVCDLVALTVDSAEQLINSSLILSIRTERTCRNSGCSGGRRRPE
jgi:hypothetical protein